MKPGATIAMTTLACLIASTPTTGQAPLVIEGRPAEKWADGACTGNIDRFKDCANGTVFDAVTGLLWLRQATCIDYPQTAGTNLAAHWPQAMQAAAAIGDGLCGLTDGSVPGDWRLPTREEWEAAIAPAALGCSGAPGPAWTDDAGTGCYGGGSGSSFLIVGSLTYWSSTATELGTSTDSAWAADLDDGDLDKLLKFVPNRSIWPVRDPR